MRHRKRSRLLWKREREFPDHDDGRVNEDGKRSVLEFAGKITADPRIRTEQRPMTFRPTAGHIGENRKDRDFVIVVPEKERVVPEQNETEQRYNNSGCESAEYFRTRGSRLGHAALLTSNVQRFLHNTTGLHSIITSTLSSIPCSRAHASKRTGGSSSGS